MTNQHIFDYLDYYVDLAKPPRYAVMLTGPWGIGKSHNIRQYLDQLHKRGKKIVYVSLYGSKSIDDMELSILTGLYAFSDNKWGQMGGRIARAALKKITFGAEADLSKFIPKDGYDLIIFDDMERALLSPVEILGFINSLIEHDGRRVVIVANEQEIADKDHYRRVREKVVGITFELVEQCEEALAYFISNVADADARRFLEEEKEVALSVFEQSQTHNLRILDQSILSWERIYKIVSPPFAESAKGSWHCSNCFWRFPWKSRSAALGATILTIGFIRSLPATSAKVKAP
jgi:hypothetical protein